MMGVPARSVAILHRTGDSEMAEYCTLCTVSTASTRTACALASQALSEAVAASYTSLGAGEGGVIASQCAGSQQSSSSCCLLGFCTAHPRRQREEGLGWQAQCTGNAMFAASQLGDQPVADWRSPGCWQSKATGALPAASVQNRPLHTPRPPHPHASRYVSDNVTGAAGCTAVPNCHPPVHTN